ncbi:hypothetical protein VTN00DRAFT_9063 [Thermoascus crustaceus]|uniref:uncharacterized protein n=1 Tax=Thermoascus crustaceus TaxID=5088 RepID=UPI003743ADFD
MDLEHENTDPFTIDDLWRPSGFALQSLQPLEPLPWDDKLPDVAQGVFESPLNLFDKNDSAVYQLDVFGSNFPDYSISANETATEISSASQAEANDVETHNEFEEFENIWSIENIAEDAGNKTQLRSWDGFPEHRFREPPSAYLSESGAHGFDAALAYQATLTGLENSGRLVRPDVFFRSLFRLGLGWNSIFFRYSEQKKTFEKELRDTRISGISLTAIDGLIKGIIQCGTNFQRIRRFIRSNPAVSNQPSALCSLASAMSVLVYSLEKELASRAKQENSLLQIGALFRRCGDLVGTLADIVGAVQKAKSDGQVISIILAKCEHLAQRFSWMEDILLEVMFRVIAPWFALVETWVGLRGEAPTLTELSRNGTSFIGAEYSQDSNKLKTAESRMIEYLFRPDMMPSFIPSEQAEMIFESGKSLRLLKQSHPRHPIARDDVLSSSLPPKLHCAMTWADIERIQNRASEYESRLRVEILRYNRGDLSKRPSVAEIGPLESHTEEAATITETFELFDIDDEKHATGLLEDNSSRESDKLHEMLAKGECLDVENAHSNESAFGPPLTSAFYLSLAPIISSQARLIEFSCLHMLFKEHKIRYHLTLQWRFQLLGDGSFASRLSHSLFDPEMESGERKSGVTRSGVHTGLRLGSRDTWPPASSELRLVLMGLLTESYESSRIPGSARFGREKELPGGLSFAIRELTGEELIKCKDPNAIEALDFLRLQYKPPAVLETIITSRSLHKYDRIFKHLLRLVRMVSVVHGLIRDSTARSSLSGDTRNVFQKFRVDAQHFVLTVSDYCFNIGVGTAWQRFETTLSRIERCLNRGDIDGTIETAHSLHRLRDYHEDILDQILFALFQSKRHAQAGKLLDDIFATILAFAPLSRMDGVSGVRHQSEKTVFQLHLTFRKQVHAFVSYLRSLDGGKASSRSYARSGLAGSSADAVTVFEHLLLRLDMKAYY